VEQIIQAKVYAKAQNATARGRCHRFFMNRVRPIDWLRRHRRRHMGIDALHIAAT